MNWNISQLSTSSPKLLSFNLWLRRKNYFKSHVITDSTYMAFERQFFLPKKRNGKPCILRKYKGDISTLRIWGMTREGYTSTWSRVSLGRDSGVKHLRPKFNEALCKMLCHNLCIVIQSIHELRIEASFSIEKVAWDQLKGEVTKKEAVKVVGEIESLATI